MIEKPIKTKSGNVITSDMVRQAHSKEETEKFLLCMTADNFTMINGVKAYYYVDYIRWALGYTVKG